MTKPRPATLTEIDMTNRWIVPALMKLLKKRKKPFVLGHFERYVIEDELMVKLQQTPDGVRFVVAPRMPELQPGGFYVGDDDE